MKINRKANPVYLEYMHLKVHHYFHRTYSLIYT